MVLSTYLVYNTVVRLKNNPPENNVEPVPAKEKLGSLSPPPSAHFQLFGGRQYIVKKTSRHQRLNRLTSINVDFIHPDDGDLDLIRRISAETRAKISWGLVTPC